MRHTPYVCYLFKNRTIFQTRRVEKNASEEDCTNSGRSSVKCLQRTHNFGCLIHILFLGFHTKTLFLELCNHLCGWMDISGPR